MDVLWAKMAKAKTIHLLVLNMFLLTPWHPMACNCIITIYPLVTKGKKNMLPKDRVASLQHLGSIKGCRILHHQCLHLPLPKRFSNVAIFLWRGQSGSKASCIRGGATEAIQGNSSPRKIIPIFFGMRGSKKQPGKHCIKPVFGGCDY